MKKLLIPLLIAGSLLTCSCSTQVDNTTEPTAPSASEPIAVAPADMFTQRDLDDSFHPSDCITISLEGNAPVCDHPNVQISGNTLTIKKEATYLITGSWEDGIIVIDAEESAKPRLVLRNASITSSTDAPLQILNADKVFITLAQGTDNALINGGSLSDQADGAVFSQQDLTFNGSGSLTVTSPAGHGIVCKDDLVFTGGSYTITSASHGCDANDSVRITNAQLTMDTGKDGIHCENSDAAQGFVYAEQCTLQLNAQGDGISAGAFLQLQNCSYSITAGGGSENGTKEHSDGWGDFMGGGPGGRPPRPRSTAASDTEDSTSMKGLKSDGPVTISGGSFTMDTADDALHGSTVDIQGGSFQIASGDDGVHADDTLTITQCTMTISESYEALEGLHVNIQGGELTLTASDDGINAAGGTDNSGNGGRDQFWGGGRPGGMGGASNGSILISGGKVKVTASGDGLDANGTLSITGGHITVTGPVQGDTATLDYDVSGTISGGTFIGTGASGMAQSFSDSPQAVIALSVGQQAAGTVITLADDQGNTLITHAPELPFSVVILSTPELEKGASYTVTVGSSSKVFQAK